MNEYFMYGILVPRNQFEGWENGTGRKFPVGIYGNVYCMFDSRDGKFFIIGKKLRKINNDNPIVVPELTESEEFDVKCSVKEHFGFEGDFHYYFVKNYK